MTTHRLKTIGRFWDAVASGEKTFEVRLNDRGFQTGDTLELLRLKNNGEPDYTYSDGSMIGKPKLLERRVSFILQGGQFGLDPLWCVIGLAPPHQIPRLRRMTVAELDPKALESERLLDRVRSTNMDRSMTAVDKLRASWPLDNDDCEELLELLDDVANYLDALSPQEAAPGAVGVKPLVWRTYPEDGSHMTFGPTGLVYRLRADTPFGPLDILVDEVSGYFACGEYDDAIYETEDAAKEAHQAAFDLNIRSALTVLPSGQNETGGEVEAVRHAFNEALDFALDKCPDCQLEFLRAWREGDTSEWPEFVPTPFVASPASGERNAVVEAQRHGIYIASKTAHADRWKLLRDKIGYPIISTWIDEAGAGESQDLSDLWQRCIREASTAEVLALNREPGEALKGGWIELGAALACGVPVLAVGIEEFTVANDKRIRHFPSMKAIMEYLKPMCNGVRFSALKETPNA